MSREELAEHIHYLEDASKLGAYDQALTSLLADHDRTLLDLGAGTGILGLIGARAGARKVYAVDSGSITGPAYDVARRSPYTDRIVHVRGRSTEIELPEPIDVAVCDQIGGFVHDAGVLEYFADARRRLLGPDGVLVPARFRLFLAPAECDVVREQIDHWGASPAGFDFSPFEALAANTEHRVDDDEVRMLGPGLEMAEINADHTEAFEGEGRTTIEHNGRCDGLVGWFEAELGSGGATLTNHPKAKHRMKRWCNLYPIATGVTVQPGDDVKMAVDVRPLLHAVTWRVEIGGPDGSQSASERHSTLLGQFLAPDDLDRSRGAPIEATPVGRALAKAITLADGTLSTDDVIGQAIVSYPGSVPAESVEQTLRQLLLRLATPAGDPR